VQQLLANMTAERDDLLTRSRGEMAQYAKEIATRKSHQEVLAKALARKEAELVTMRVQVHSHALLSQCT
jgi:hypothetical protein